MTRRISFVSIVISGTPGQDLQHVPRDLAALLRRQVAAHEVPGRRLQQVGPDAQAGAPRDPVRVRAARLEDAAFRQVDRRRRVAANGVEPLGQHAVHARDRREEPERVGHLGPIVEHAPVGATSTIRPPYITATSSATSATMPRSWVIRMTVVPNSACRFEISSRIWAWTVTSSAVVGSSAISSSGELMSAIAIITRWRMPPDSWCG